MKATYVSILLLIGALSALAQGTITFNNDILGQVVAPIYGPEAGDATVAKFGNTSSGYPPGFQTYTGALLAGSGWSAQLLGAPGTQPSGPLIPLGPAATFRTGSGAGFIVPETIVLSFPPGTTTATYQVAVWDNQGGTVPDWSVAQFEWSMGLIAARLSPAFPGPASGSTTFLRSFNVTIVPEPPSLALLGLAGMGLFVHRRKADK